jgi:TetR/AcrR family transcriptional regulator, repressor for uid operon
MPKVSDEYKTKVKNIIYHAALKNFAKTGYANTKMEDIAKTAKVSKGTLYLYFQSKEELFYHMCRQNQQILIEIREGLFKKKSDLMADLSRFYDDIVSKEGDTERTWVEGIAESLHNKKIKHVIIQQRKNLDEIVTEFLKQMKKDGGFFKDDTDLKALARGMIALYPMIQSRQHG